MSETNRQLVLFMVPAQTLTERRQAKRQTLEDRVKAVADLVNESSDTWLIWCHLNDESELLAKLIPDAKDVKGSDPLEAKENRINAFSSGRLRVLITKPSIAGFGMNWQHCHKVAFVGLSDSFEQYYQAVRRCYRFGQQSTVDVHLVTADIEGNVLANLMRKESQHNELSESLVDHMRTMMQKEVLGTVIEKTEYKTDVAKGDKWTMHLGDCVEIVAGMDEESIDYTIFQPAFLVSLHLL